MSQHKMCLSDCIPNNLLGAFDPVNHHSQEVGIVKKLDELWSIPAFPHAAPVCYILPLSLFVPVKAHISFSESPPKSQQE